MTNRRNIVLLTAALLSGCILAPPDPESAISVDVAGWKQIDGGPDVSATFLIRNNGDADAWWLSILVMSNYVASPYVFDQAAVKGGPAYMSQSLFAAEEVLPSQYQIERTVLWILT